MQIYLTFWVKNFVKRKLLGKEKSNFFAFNTFLEERMRNLKYIQTCIHNWLLQLSSQCYGLASHTTDVVFEKLVEETAV